MRFVRIWACLRIGTMAERIQQMCREPGCLERTADRSGYCAAHQLNNSRKQQRAVYDRERHSDPVARLYGTARWAKLKTMLRHRGNLICQRIVDGKQCTRYAEIYHHLVSPKDDVSLMFSPHNICGVCRQHHPPDEGTPWWVEGTDYVATIWTEVTI